MKRLVVRVNCSDWGVSDAVSVRIKSRLWPRTTLLEYNHLYARLRLGELQKRLKHLTEPIIRGWPSSVDFYKNRGY